MPYLSAKIKTLLVTFFVIFGSFFVFLEKSQAAPSINKSLEYIYLSQDYSSGGIIEKGEQSPSFLRTDWAIIAFGASSYNPKTVGLSRTLTDFVLSDACSLTSLTDVQRRVLALESSLIDSTKVQNCNLIEKITSSIKDNGQIGNDLVSTVFGVLSLRSSGQNVSQDTVDFIISNQDSSGGWDSGYGVESNFTAQTIMALKSSGKIIDQKVFERAKNYLKSLQTSTGGIKYDGGQWSVESDAFSDSFVIQAIYSMGENPEDLFWRNSSKSIFDDLDALSNSDGSYNFNRSYGKINPVWTTSIVLLAQNESFLPVLKKRLLPWESVSPSPIATSIVSPSPIAISSPSGTPTCANNLETVQANTSANNNFSQESKKSYVKTNSKQIANSSSSTNSKGGDNIIGENKSAQSNTKNDLVGKVLSYSSHRSNDLWYFVVSVALLGFVGGILGRYLIKKYEQK